MRLILKEWINIFSKPIFCLTLINQSYFFCLLMTYFFIYRVEITNFYMSFFFLPRLVFQQSSFKFHPFRFLSILFKKGLFIEKITLNSIQDWWRLAISQHQTLQSVSAVGLVSVDALRRPRRRCLVPWVSPLVLPWNQQEESWLHDCHGSRRLHMLDSNNNEPMANVILNYIYVSLMYWAGGETTRNYQEHYKHNGKWRPH